MKKNIVMVTLFTLVVINFIIVIYTIEVGDWLNNLPRYVKPTLQMAILGGWIFILYSIRKIINSKK